MLFVIRTAFFLSLLALVTTTEANAGFKFKKFKIGGDVGRAWQDVKKYPAKLIVPVGGAVLITACILNPAPCTIVVTSVPK